MTTAEMARIHAAAFTLPRPWSEAEIAGFLADRLCFVLTESSGFSLGRVVAGQAELLTIAVDPDARRQGAGARLLAGFLRESSARGAESVFLEVAATNEAALALYEKHGFSPIGRRKGYYCGAGAPVDALILGRPA